MVDEFNWKQYDVYHYYFSIHTLRMTLTCHPLTIHYRILYLISYRTSYCISYCILTSRLLLIRITPKFLPEMPKSYWTESAEYLNAWGNYKAVLQRKIFNINPNIVSALDHILSLLLSSDPSSHQRNHSSPSIFTLQIVLVRCGAKESKKDPQQMEATCFQP